MLTLRKRGWILAGFLALAVSASCRRGDVETVPVEGVLTSGGSSWPVSGTLFFTPVDPAPGLPRRPGWAQFTPEGQFRVTTFRAGDGLIPGKYQAAVEAFASPWRIDQPRPASCVPPQFASPASSGLEVVVLPGQKKITLNWDVPKP